MRALQTRLAEVVDSVRPDIIHAHSPALDAFPAFAVAGKPTSALFIFHNNPPEVLAQAGFPLPIVYVFWIAGVLALYPICKWYAELKRRRNDWWLGYL